MATCVRKPDGGFCFMTGRAILGAWWAYRAGEIGLRDFRVWLGSFEVVARRCGLPKGRTPHYRMDELNALVGGVGGEHVRHSIRSLERAGLLHWRECRVQSTVGHETLEEHTPGFTEALSQLASPDRPVPVPRRLLRFLAATSRPVLIATALGHLLRCAFYRRGECSGRGRCKASWVAEVFGVDERNVKGARSELVRLNIIAREAGPQHLANRWGGAVVLNLQWAPPPASEHRSTVVVPPTASPPPGTLSTTESPPPGRTMNSLSRSENQEPGRAGPPGCRKPTGTEPTLRNVRPADLADPVRLANLWHQAVRGGLCGHGEAHRLQFFAAAAHAQRVGRANPCGLFATVVRRGLWSFLSSEDEDVGRRVVRELPPTLRPTPNPVRRYEPPREPLTQEEVRRLVLESLSVHTAAG